MSHMLYGVSSREIIFNGEYDFEDMRRNHVCYLYRYEDTVFGDFTAYEENGNLCSPKTFATMAS